MQSAFCQSTCIVQSVQKSVPILTPRYLRLIGSVLYNLMCIRKCRNVQICQVKRCSKRPPFSRTTKPKRIVMLMKTFLKPTLVNIGYHLRYSRNKFCNCCRALIQYLWFHVNSQIKTQGVRSGERAGHGIGPPLPIHLFQCFMSKYCLTVLAKAVVPGLA